MAASISRWENRGAAVEVIVNERRKVIRRGRTRAHEQLLFLPVHLHSVFWFVPNPVCGWFDWIHCVVFDRLGEVMLRDMAIYKENRRNEFLIVLFELI